jgi:hypothetical protein
MEEHGKYVGLYDIVSNECNRSSEVSAYAGVINVSRDFLVYVSSWYSVASRKL